MFPFLGGLASGALGLLGGSMNASAQQSMNDQMIAMQQAVNAQQGAEWQTANQEAQQQQYISNAMANQVNQFQEYMATNGIQMRAADARAAGISPLAALGIPLAGGPSASVGGGSTPAPASGGVPSLTAPQPGAGVASLGQDISRALQATQSPEDKAVAVEKTRQDLEKGDLENQLLKSQIASSSVATKMDPTQTGPGIVSGFSDKPVPYWQASPLDSDAVKVLPSKEASAADWAALGEKLRYEGLTAGKGLTGGLGSYLDKITGKKSGPGDRWSYDPVSTMFYRKHQQSAIPSGQNGVRMQVLPDGSMSY